MLGDDFLCGVSLCGRAWLWITGCLSIVWGKSVYHEACL